MSQIYKSLLSGPVPPAVPTSFVTDDGTAIPAANVLNVLGIDSTENNVSGILTRANPNLSNNLEIVITNRLQGTGSTVGAVTADIITFALSAVAHVYTFDFSIAGFSSGSSEGVGYTLVGSVRSDGATATVLPNQTLDNFEEGALVACTALMVASGNNVILRVTGTAGTTIQWGAVGTYVLI